MGESLTIIIPAYGPGPHLEEVVAALDGQLPQESRVIISHSGAGDPSARFAGNPRVTVLHSDERLFAGAARNRGLALSSTDWVAFIDEDVVPAADWHDALRRSIAAGDADCILGSIGWRTSGGYWGMALWFAEFGPCHPYLAKRRIEGGGSCNMAVRRSAFDAIGGFPEDWRISEDTVAQARLSAAGSSLLFEPAVIVKHHNPGGLRHMLRHLFHYGRYSARARREYPGLRGGLAVRWPILSLGIGAAKAVQMTRRVMTAKQSPKLQYVKYLPGILLGVAAWNVGFAREAFLPGLKASDY